MVGVHIRSFFNPVHDKAGRFGTGAGGGGSATRTKAGDALLDKVTADNAEGVKALYDPDPQDAVATALNLNNAPSLATIGAAKVAAREKSQTYLAKKYPEGEVTLHRGGKGNAEVPGSLQAWTPDRATAQRFAGGDAAKIRTRKLAISRIELALPGLGYSMEEEYLVPMSPGLAVRSFYNRRHDKRTGQFAPKAGGGTSIGVTPYRGDRRSKVPAGQTEVEGITPYFGTTRYKGFTNAARSSAAGHNVKLASGERAAGFWEGGLEPSAQIRVRGSKADVKSYATDLGKRFDQDGVIAFTPRKGGSSRRYRWRVENPSEGVSVLKNAGVMGATVKGRSIEVLDLDGTALAAVGKVRATLGRGQVSRGDGRLWEKGRDYASAIMTQVRSVFQPRGRRA